MASNNRFFLLLMSIGRPFGSVSEKGPSTESSSAPEAVFSGELTVSLCAIPCARSRILRFYAVFAVRRRGVLFQLASVFEQTVCTRELQKLASALAK